MSKTNNSSNVTGKSSTNAFDIIANSLVVLQTFLLKGIFTAEKSITVKEDLIVEQDVSFLSLSPLQTIITNSSKKLVTKKGGSNTIFNALETLPVENNSWTPVKFLFIARQKGSAPITWIDQFTGFRNDSGESLLVSISFTTKRVANPFGTSSIRILLNGSLKLAEQDVTAMDSVTASVNTYLDPTETIQCQVWHNAGTSPGFPLFYENIAITINTYPLVV